MTNEKTWNKLESDTFLLYENAGGSKKTSSAKSLGFYIVAGLLTAAAIIGIAVVTSKALVDPSHVVTTGTTAGPTSATNSKVSIKDTVCIVGAGPSGLGTAARLRSKGYSNVIVFEKSDLPGGKAQNWVDSATNVPYFMGPVIGVLESYPTVLSYLSEYSTPYVLVEPSPIYLYNAELGTIVNASANSPDPTPAVVAFQKYVALRAKYTDYLQPGYKKGIPAELSVPLHDWLAANDLLALQSALWIGVTSFGYGSLKEIPAFYALLPIDGPVLLYFLGRNQVFITNFHELFSKVASALPDVRYGVQITQTRRVSNGKNNGKNKPVTLTYTDSSKVQKSQDCDSLVLAFPQRLDLLANFDLDEKETEIFSAVKTNQYSSSIVHADGPSIGYHLNFLQFDPTKSPPIFTDEPKGNGQPIIFRKQQAPFSNFTVAYSWKSDFLPGPAFSSSDFDAATIKTMSLVNRYENAPPSGNVPVTADDIKANFIWDYFPHVSAADAKAGFYQKFEALQGHRQTYFTSGLRGFETVEASLRSAHDLVETYF